MYFDDATARDIQAIEKYVSSSDGVQVYATAAGRSDNPPIVFIHGIALSALVFAQLFQSKSLLDNFFLVSSSMWRPLLHSTNSVAHFEGRIWR